MNTTDWKCRTCGYITSLSNTLVPTRCQHCSVGTEFEKLYYKKKAMRTNYISWDTYFMGVAMLAAQRSKDPSTQVGACIVNSDNIIVGVGYNGMPRGCDDDIMPWEREGESALDTKYPYVCHAELNAILNTNSASLKDCTLYVTLHPCNECAKAIIQSGIKKIVYYENKYANTDGVKAAAKMFRLSDVEVVKYTRTEDMTLPL